MDAGNFDNNLMAFLGEHLRRDGWIWTIEE
jgi:hypothetical protein